MDVCVVGGGASGLVAALTAARGGCRVKILECKEKPGKKIYATGNGKCNLTNRKMGMDCYRSSDREMRLAKQALECFDEKKTLQFFSSMGLMFRERDGYVYPSTGQASTVVNVLVEQCNMDEVEILCHTEVSKISKKKEKFVLDCCYQEKKDSQKQFFTEIADAVILAVGTEAGGFGSAYGAKQLLSGLEIGFLPWQPALCGLHCAEKKFFSLCSGVRCEGEIKLYTREKGRETFLAGDSGELQFTDYGISGIPVFQVSRYACYALAKGREVVAKLNLLPEFSPEELQKHFLNTTEKNLQRDFSYVFHEKLVGAMMQREKNLTKERLSALFKSAEFRVTQCHQQNAQVYAGGVPAYELDAQFQSVKYENLYIVGEMTDVDGICGGYNLQYAWSSGYVAGKSVAEKR